MKVIFKNQELEPKWGFQQLILFEKLMKRPYLGTNLEDHLVYLYCALIVALKDKVTYEEFFEFVDANPDVVEEWLKYLSESIGLKEEDKKEDKTE